MLRNNSWDKPLIEIIWETSKGTKTYHSWPQGRLACLLIDISALVWIINLMIEWVSK
jgi:hypothetical protein